ncbi:replication initiation protein [Aneurinibacillus thermoaerophilus]|jgi:hypothetical protein|uniref:Replication initiation protein n=1 Tax=Aneurinibacillus thermoaerophilus TaxID=143495 RepID=A0ABX8YE10_ANETH|nr:MULTISPECIES: hypothetical protein [Aneurinibacillus]AMA73474.1 replication initiation protein [Aneurinibacillus sp. XH2]QYY43951.1 replication initiation protein [Aneurinibacillus thermoaerophilus]
MTPTVSVDKLVLEYKDVPLSVFYRFFMRVLLQKYKVRWRVYRKLYCYQFHIRMGKGEYLHVFYKNFREKEGFLHTLRLETRPEYYERLSEIWEWLRQKASRVEFVSCDIAYDVPFSLENVVVMSRDIRRSLHLYKTTRYFGVPHQRKQNGYCRVYDKKQELWDRHGIQMEGELTRIEIVYKPAENIELTHIRDCPPEQNKQYYAAVITDWAAMKPKKAEQIRNIQNGTNLYTRYIREGVKKELASQYVLDFNGLARKEWERILEPVYTAVLGVA